MQLPLLPTRSKAAHKGDCGRVLVVGGSRGMAGAPCLAARAACRGGAGLVKVAVPESVWDLAAVKLDECLTAGLPETGQGALARAALEPLKALAEWSDVTVLGPGLSQDAETADLVREAVAQVRGPLLLDADGLNAFGGRLAELAAAQKARGAAALVLTPHPGEMARLQNVSISEVQKSRRKLAAAVARQTGAVVVLKGAGTVVSDGRRGYVNTTGNPGLASGGTGDVLAGLIAALIGQKMKAFEAACLGVYLHGLAGDLAAKRLGVWSLTAGDLIDKLPRAFRRHARKK